MADVPKAALAAAVLGGYVLGRTKKGRVAFAMATYLAGRRIGLEPQQMLAEGIKRLRELPSSRTSTSNSVVRSSMQGVER